MGADEDRGRIHTADIAMALAMALPGNYLRPSNRTLKLGGLNARMSDLTACSSKWPNVVEYGGIHAG